MYNVIFYLKNLIVKKKAFIKLDIVIKNNYIVSDNVITGLCLVQHTYLRRS